MVSVRNAKIISLIYQIFAILGEIILLLLSPNDKEEIEFNPPSPISSPSSNSSTPPPISASKLHNQVSSSSTSSSTSTSLYDKQQATNDSIDIASSLTKAISIATLQNSLLPHNQIIARSLAPKRLNRKKVIVVTLDGGGIRGIVTLTILRELQKMMGLDIIDKAHMVCGTSTGSIIAMGRSKPLPYDEIVEIYKNFGKVIFKGTVKNFFVGATLANSDKKEQELIKVFGNNTMGTFAQNKKLFVVVSKLKHNNSLLQQQQQQQQLPQQNFINQSTPSSLQQPQQQNIINQQQESEFKTKIISNYNKKYENVKVSEALNASSAAPIYFKPVEINGHKYVDGGIGYQNNPILLAHKECLKLFGDMTEYLFISLGTGTFEATSTVISPSSKKIIFQAQETFKNAVGLIKNAASSIGDSETPHQIFKQMSNYKNVSYYRFNPKLTQNFSLSDTSKSSLDAMETEARQYMQSQDMIREVQNLKNEIESIINSS
ncbi:hypothetical protein ACTFIW_008061 [Dictyostelium discoideum]